MFSLIITIISIALVAALALATLYYGGSAFSQGSAKANAASIIEQAQQIAGANTLFANNVGGGNYATALSTLTTAQADGSIYLNANPAPPAGAVSAGAAYTLGSTTANTVNLAMAGTGAASICQAIVNQVSPGSSVSATQNAARQYDCFGSGASYTFQFKS